MLCILLLVLRGANKLDWMMMSPWFHGFVPGLPFILPRTDILTDIRLYFFKPNNYRCFGYRVLKLVTSSTEMCGLHDLTATTIRPCEVLRSWWSGLRWVKSQSMVLRKGKVHDGFRFCIAGTTIPLEEPVKSLGNFFLTAPRGMQPPSKPPAWSWMAGWKRWPTLNY